MDLKLIESNNVNYTSEKRHEVENARNKWKTRLKSSSLTLPSHSMYITVPSAPNTAHPPSWLYSSPLGLSFYNSVSPLHLVFLIAFCVSHKMHCTRERTWRCLIHGCVPNSRLQMMAALLTIYPQDLVQGSIAFFSSSIRWQTVQALQA